MASKKILIIDDEVGTLNLLKTIFEKEGYLVTGVQNGIKIIEKNRSLTQFIIETTDAKIEDGGSGAFYIYLKNKNEFRE